ncbi:hypothetical protein SMICM304S_01391 [Streptomyces microflavus]
MTAGRPRTVRSSFFEDLDRFPPGSAVLDSALVMRGVAADWSQGEPMRVGCGAGAAQGGAENPRASPGRTATMTFARLPVPLPRKRPHEF